MSTSKSLHSKSINDINDIIEFLVEYYSSFIIEDSLFQSLRNFIKSVVEELRIEYVRECSWTSNSHSCRREVENFLRRLLSVFYAASNEPVRLGAFRVLFNEVYKRVHGSFHSKSTEGIDLALHGILREKLVVLSSERRNLTESYHVGIDYVSLIEYPTPNQKQKVIVPLFIIAKSRDEEIKEIRIQEAISKALQQGVKSANVKSALQNIPRFTRIVLTRAIYNKNTDEIPCTVNKGYQNIQNIPVYTDIACGIIGPVFMDIPKMYSEIVNDKGLADLTIGDWIEALLSLAMPVVQVVVAQASSPPTVPGAGGLSVNDVVSRIRQEALERVGAEVEKQIRIARRYVMRLKPELEQKLAKITNRYREYRGVGTRIYTT